MNGSHVGDEQQHENLEITMNGSHVSLNDRDGGERQCVNLEISMNTPSEEGQHENLEIGDPIRLNVVFERGFWINEWAYNIES